MSSPDTPAPKKRFNPWPWMILAAVLTVIAANVILVYIANRNPPVLETTAYYEKAVTHQATIDERTQSLTLGWHAKVAVTDGRLRYVITDAQGAPVTGLSGVVGLKRNETTALDASLTLTEASPGTYEGTPADTRAGVWRLEARFDGGPSPWLDERSLRLP